MTDPERGQFGKQAYWDFVRGLKSIQQLEVLVLLRRYCRHINVIGCQTLWTLHSVT
jgi:hypothetical protein